MSKIIDWFKTKKIEFYLSLASVVFGLIALVVYLCWGKTQFDPDYSGRAIGAFVVGIVLGICFLIRPYKEGVFLQYLAFFLAFLFYITSQMNMLANILYDVDGSTLPAAFITIIIFSLIAFVAPLVACFLMKDKNAVKGESEVLKESKGDANE
jgi:lysylphosphatidylglycerol synthetase-like protein (DUF2156 family)